MPFVTGSPLRAVLDTNVYVSAVLNPAGPSGQVLRALHRRDFVAVSSPAILDEVTDVLTRTRVMRRTKLDVADVAKLRVWLKRNTDVIKGEYQNLDIVPTDTKDNPVAAAALESKAPYLVTQDAADLLRLKAFHVSGHAVVQIIEPISFLLEVLRER